MAAAALALVLAAGPSDDFTLPEYRGSHYTEKAEEFLTCAALRESSGRWKADGPWGSGAFQIIGSTWDHYAELAGYPEWVGMRPAEAPSYVQTEVAYVMVNPFPNKPGLEGAFHWSPKWARTVGKNVKDCA